jgi:hypothetical protein
VFAVAPSLKESETHGSRAGLVIGLVVGTFVLVIGTATLTLWASGYFSKSTNRKPTYSNGSNLKFVEPIARETQLATDAKGSESAGKPRNKENDEPATVFLQAPSIDKSRDDPYPIRAFTDQMRHLAEGGLDTPYPAATVFTTVFDQQIHTLSKDPAAVLGRNVIVLQGSFDKSLGSASWDFYLWYHHLAAVSTEDIQLPEDTDFFVLKATFKQTPEEALIWQDAFNKGILKIKLNYRIQKVISRQWKPHPRLRAGKDFLPGGEVKSHDIEFRVDVTSLERDSTPSDLRFPSALPAQPQISERDRLLAEVEKKHRRNLARIEEQMRALDRDKEDLARLRLRDPTNFALFAMANRLLDSLAHIDRQMEEDKSAYEREVRKIMREHPLPGDPR